MQCVKCEARAELSVHTAVLSQVDPGKYQTSFGLVFPSPEKERVKR